MAIETDKDRVRLLIGDTNEEDPQLSDNEVEEAVSYNKVENEDEELVTNIPAAAADCCAAIAAKYSRSFDFAEDGQSFNVAQRVSHYLALEEKLRRRAGVVSVPYGASS
jgi:hypothetical protein